MQRQAKIGSALVFALISCIVFHNLGINNNGGSPFVPPVNNGTLNST